MRRGTTHGHFSSVCVSLVSSPSLLPPHLDGNQNHSPPPVTDDKTSLLPRQYPSAAVGPLLGTVLSTIWICSSAAEARAHLGSAAPWRREARGVDLGTEPCGQVTPRALSDRDRPKRTPQACILSLEKRTRSKDEF